MVQLNRPDVQKVVLHALLEDPAVQALVNDRNRVTLLTCRCFVVILSQWLRLLKAPAQGHTAPILVQSPLYDGT